MLLPFHVAPCYIAIEVRYLRYSISSASETLVVPWTHLMRFVALCSSCFSRHATAVTWSAQLVQPFSSNLLLVATYTASNSTFQMSTAAIFLDIFLHSKKPLLLILPLNHHCDCIFKLLDLLSGARWSLDHRYTLLSIRTNICTQENHTMKPLNQRHGVYHGFGHSLNVERLVKFSG